MYHKKPIPDREIELDKYQHHGGCKQYEKVKANKKRVSFH